MKFNALSAIIYGAIALVALSPKTTYAQSQGEMNRQANEDFTRADDALNKIYNQLLRKIDKQSQEKLRVAQRAWIQFRDAEADLEADFEARGGSMRPLIYNTRRGELTETRTNELRQMLKNYSSQ